MTHFILSGSGVGSLELREAARKMDTDKSKAHLLVIPFAYYVPPTTKPEAPAIDQIAGWFTETLSDLTGIPIIPDIALPRLADFRRQVRKADVIVTPGGNGDLLQQVIPKYDEFQTDICRGNKVIVGGSAGTNVWAHTYYSNDNAAVCAGLGVLPIKTFCHFQAWKFRQLTELIQAGDRDMPIFPLADSDVVALQFA